MAVRLSIVILHWKNCTATARCLESVAALAGGPFPVLVVDNGADENSAEFFSRRFPKVEVLALPENLGYAGGNNEGIRHVLHSGAEFVLLLNNDVVVDPDTVEGLMAVAGEDPRVGIAGPKVCCMSRERLLFAAGSFVDWRRGEVVHRGLFQPEESLAGSGGGGNVDFLVGCCLLLRRSCIEQVGLFDVEYFLNFEDVDLGVRAGRAGLDVVYVPGSRVWHEVSASLGRGSPVNTYYMTRNALRFFWMRSAPGIRWLAVTRIIARTLRSITAWSLAARYRDELHRRKRLANVHALADFFQGRFGAMSESVRRACGEAA